MTWPDHEDRPQGLKEIRVGAGGRYGETLAAGCPEGLQQAQVNQPGGQTEMASPSRGNCIKHGAPQGQYFQKSDGLQDPQVQTAKRLIPLSLS